MPRHEIERGIVLRGFRGVGDLDVSVELVVAVIPVEDV
jgi:hypothetical protein